MLPELNDPSNESEAGSVLAAQNEKDISLLCQRYLDNHKQLQALKKYVQMPSPPIMSGMTTPSVFEPPLPLSSRVFNKELNHQTIEIFGGTTSL